MQKHTTLTDITTLNLIAFHELLKSDGVILEQALCINSEQALCPTNFVKVYWYCVFHVFHERKFASYVLCAVFLQGVNVREKAKQLVTLLKDEERLREERIHALKTKEKMAQTSSGET